MQCLYSGYRRFVGTEHTVAKNLTKSGAKFKTCRVHRVVVAMFQVYIYKVDTEFEIYDSEGNKKIMDRINIDEENKKIKFVYKDFYKNLSFYLFLYSLSEIFC